MFMNETPIGTKRIYIASAGFLILLVVSLAWYYGYRGTPEQESQKATEERKEGGKEEDSPAPAIVDIEGSGRYTVSAVPLSEIPSREGMPRLRREVLFSASFSPEAQGIMRQKIDASIAALEKDPRVLDEWMQLAILRKTVDDYEGAREIWEFLARTSPNQFGPFANLASLYAFDLKDAARAEQNFTTALALWTKDISVWRNAHDFYRHVRKNDEKAKQMLREGIEHTKSPDLQYLLDHYDG